MNGIIIINKPKGFTSFDVVAKLRGILKTKKIGHTGTLDPDATGVLPVCVGKATKVVELLSDRDKSYLCTLRLGITTDTEDMTGKILTDETNKASSLDEAFVRSAILSFEGDYNQIPPMYSALKVNGKKLYELAREGKEIERKARPVFISKIDIKEIKLPEVIMEVTCSKGTYIRTLCADIGTKLSVGGAMASLHRTRVGTFGIDEALSLEEVEQLANEGSVDEKLIEIDRVFDNLTKVVLKEESDRFLYNGNELFEFNFAKVEPVKDNFSRIKVYDSTDEFVAIYKQIESKDGEEKSFLCEKFFGKDK